MQKSLVALVVLAVSGSSIAPSTVKIDDISDSLSGSRTTGNGNGIRPTQTRLDSGSFSDSH